MKEKNESESEEAINCISEVETLFPAFDIDCGEDVLVRFGQ